MNKLLLITLVCTVSFGCTQTKTEKHHKRNRIVNVREMMKEIVIEDVFINSNNRLLLSGDYLIIMDPMSMDEVMYLFDRDSFRYITGFGRIGQGPGEIANLGYVTVNDMDGKIYVSDHGKHVIFSYDIDSVLYNPRYIPEIKVKIDNAYFPAAYQYYNDTLSIARIITMGKTAGFGTSVAKWNMLTGEITPMKYEHPKIQRKNSSVTSSLEHGIYVEYYYYHDLLSICTFDGDLKYNIYGEDWTDRNTGNRYYEKVIICNNRIIASYVGGNPATGMPPTKFHIFDLNGDYLQTLETGYDVVDFCYDEKNNRILMSLDDAEIQFAYLNLDGLI